jgi:hypothetical protein
MNEKVALDFALLARNGGPCSQHRPFFLMMFHAFKKSCCTSGLPDDIFLTRFGIILVGLAMKAVGIFYGHFVNFPAIWYTLWLFGIFYVHLV